jgi:hypothetical protein
MMAGSTFKGIIRGKTIELEAESGLPEGQAVTVTLHPASESLPPGEGLRRSFGAWAAEATELDQFLEQIRQQRKIMRREIDP